MDESITIQRMEFKETLSRKQRAFRIFLTISTIALVISTIGFIVQFWLITADYARKDVVTEMRVQLAFNLGLPDISFCVPLPNAVNFTLLDEKHPKFVQQLKEKYEHLKTSHGYTNILKGQDESNYVYGELVTNFNLEELSQLFYETHEIFVSIDLINTRTHFGILSEEEFNDLCHWKTYFHEASYCYCLSCSSKKPFVIRPLDLILATTEGKIAEFRIPQKIFRLIDHFHIFFTSVNQYPRGIKKSSIVVRALNRSILREFSFKRFATYRLPPPFTTNCRDYKSEGFESRLAEIEECQNNYFRKEYKTPFYGNVHFAEKNTSHPYTEILKVDASARTHPFILKMFQDCLRLAGQHDCVEEYFIATETSSLVNKGGFTRLVLVQPTEPENVHIANEKLPFTEYLILIQSLVGTYFGVSMAFTFPQVLHWIFFERRKSVKKIRASMKR